MNHDEAMKIAETIIEQNMNKASIQANGSEGYLQLQAAIAVALAMAEGNGKAEGFTLAIKKVAFMD